MATKIPVGWFRLGYDELLKEGDMWLLDGGSGAMGPVKSSRLGKSYDYWEDQGIFGTGGVIIRKIATPHTWVRLEPTEFARAGDIIHQCPNPGHEPLDACDASPCTIDMVYSTGYVTCGVGGYGNGQYRVSKLLGMSKGMSIWRKTFGPPVPRQLPGNPHFAEPLPLP
jgi:hypothetical protein